MKVHIEEAMIVLPPGNLNPGFQVLLTMIVDVPILLSRFNFYISKLRLPSATMPTLGKPQVKESSRIYF